MSAAAAPVGATRADPAGAISKFGRRNAWVLGLLGVLIGLFLFTKGIQPRYGPIPIQGLAVSVLPLVFAAVAQAIVVIGGGIDLSIGSMMALTSVVSATLMQDQSEAFAVGVVIGVLLLGLLIGGINGGLVGSRASRTSSSRSRCRSCGPDSRCSSGAPRAAVPRRG